MSEDLAVLSNNFWFSKDPVLFCLFVCLFFCLFCGGGDEESGLVKDIL